MPAIANMTIKKNDGTTDIVWTGVQPASGDGTPATFKSQTVGVASAHQPELRVSSKDGAKGATRVIRVTYKYPQIATNTTTSVTSVIANVTGTFELIVPKAMAATDVNEAATQLGNLLDHTLMNSVMKEGYAPS